VAAVAAGPTLPLPDKPSIAVLPFDNLSGDERYGRLADGITEDLIADLSRFRELFVIARNSSEFYKDKVIDVRQIARELGVQYVLEGSLQSDGERVRITAQLIDATTRNHVWSQRYDRPLGDLFTVQDEVTQAIANAIGTVHGVIDAAGREGARRKPPESLEAYDYYLLGKEHQQRFTEEGNGKAEELLTKAIELAPGFARAYVTLGFTYINAYDNSWHRPREETRVKWLDAAKTAVALDPLDGYARMPLAWYYWYTSDFAHAVPEFERAIDLNPNDADVLALSAVALPWLGKPEQAVELLERAMRLNPHFPNWYLGMARDVYFYAGQFEKSIAAAKQKKSPTIWDVLTQPLAYAQLGREEEAAAGAAEFLEREPDYSAEKWLSDMGQFARENELNLFLDSNEKAGLPLCATAEQLQSNPDMKRLERCEAERASG
jgi:TolB-like protein/Tfp pilus assembly protein PilF